MMDFQSPPEKNLRVILKNERHFEGGLFDALSTTKRITFISLTVRSVETDRGRAGLTRI